MKRLFACLALTLLVSSSALADGPSAQARAERQRTIQRRRERQAQSAANASARQASRARVNAAISSLPNQAMPGGAPSFAPMMPQTPRVQPPMILQPNYLIYNRNSNGQTGTTLIYGNPVLAPPPQFPNGVY